MPRAGGVISPALTYGIALTVAVLWGAVGVPGWAATEETVQISLPPIVSFTVPDVGATTQASPSPTTIAFSGATLDAGRALRISVKAEGNLTGPGGTIAASQVSWAVSNVLHGVGSNGQLSSTGYAQVFDGQAGATSGSLDVVWSLSAPGTAMHAGVYQVTLRWRVEAITP